mgnify:CR=1 FL=1
MYNCIVNTHVISVFKVIRKRMNQRYSIAFFRGIVVQICYWIKGGAVVTEPNDNVLVSVKNDQVKPAFFSFLERICRFSRKLNIKLRYSSLVELSPLGIFFLKYSKYQNFLFLNSTTLYLKKF